MTPTPRKGQQTTGKILGAAELLFARNGYAGTSLRQIATAAGLREPGLYNHFDSKQAIYTAVLHRALEPIGQVLSGRLSEARSLPDFIELPGALVDTLARAPHVAALLQRAVSDEGDQPGNAVLHRWLSRLFDAGLEGIAGVADDVEQKRNTLVINALALFNMATGYFVAQPAISALGAGNVIDEANLVRQKQLLHRVIRAMMVS